MWIQRIILWCLSLIFATGLSAQLTEQRLSFTYDETPLYQVLDDLEERYLLYFSYNPDYLPLEYGISVQVQDQPVPQAIEVLFEQAPVRYAFIGDQIALRADPGKQLAQIEARPPQPKQRSPIYPEARPTPARVEPIKVIDPPIIDTGQEDWMNERVDPETLAKITAAMEAHERELAAEEYDANHRLAQISLLPFLGTNTHRSHEITNKVSINVLWGTSRGVDGFELGGVANSVSDDVYGVQIAGGANWVGQDMTGTQFAGLLNRVGGKATGVQSSFGANYVRDSLVGVQVAGLFNIAGSDVDGEQWANLFNYTRGNVRHQYSLLYNEADEVAKRQIGLINVCDTTSRGPIGFLSIVRRGYNRLELGSTEGFYVHGEGKLGTRRFYNIFHLGLRWDEVQRTEGGQSTTGSFMSWAIGYGFGAAPRLGKKLLLNTEIVGMHVNELEPWTDDWNMLMQGRLTLDWQVSKHLSFYAGPTLNLMWSEVYNAETETYGSLVAPDHVMWNQQNGATNFKGWIGFTAGLRL